MKGLHGKVAIVTGAARGIGRAVAERLVEEGMKVMLADVDQHEGGRVTKMLGAEQVVRFTECDVAEKLDVRNLIAETTDAFGPIDLLVNNAGILRGADFLELSEEDFDRVMRVNLKGAFLLSQSVARHMVERVQEGQPAGSIVNISSVSAILAMSTQLSYSVSKAALAQLTKVSAIALAPYGIRVNAVGPGAVESNMLDSAVDQSTDRKTIISRTPMGRIARPQEIASVVAFLASADASYVTGQTVYADGGRLPLAYTVPPS